MSFLGSLAPILGAVVGNLVMPGVGGLIGGAIGGAAGGADKHAAAADKERRQRSLAASTQRYSPWTHMQAGPIEEAGSGLESIGGGALGGGMTGYSMGGAFKGAAPTPMTDAGLGKAAPAIGSSAAPAASYGLGGAAGGSVAAPQTYGLGSGIDMQTSPWMDMQNQAQNMFGDNNKYASALKK